jgi:hypothetical protein
MQSSKIQLSAEELAMVQDSHWLLTKNKILGTVTELFGELAGIMREMTASNSGPFRNDILLVSPKIARGENYQGLPYIMLDYPRVFGKDDILAVRTMFWWGNFISITLHLKGRYKHHYVPVIRKFSGELAAWDFHIGISENEWVHEFSDQNYLSMNKTGNALLEEILAKNLFCKLSVKIPLYKWNESKEILVDLYKVCINILNH